ncbi:hypothetical protein EJ08DRAFT_634942 [Tothia fuscella]|uniref:Methyltransferase domain-containing protein n=1 Tax=Tothia fuscella TaxID=1048955 RepID=A0A9P4NPP9_9PEZI|nr:hypothetical protein EJ08DRAFT_634942 [Tothia fuscella]
MSENDSKTQNGGEGKGEAKGSLPAQQSQSEPENIWGDPITKLKPEAHVLLVHFAKIPEEEIIPHVLATREKAWKVCPYGCIGKFLFVDPTIQNHSYYKPVLERTKKSNGEEGDMILDLGCGFGQNMRQLVLDGVPRDRVFGADISEDLINCGYDYFKDGNADTRFMSFIGDLLKWGSGEEKPSAYDMAKEQFDIIYTAIFYHLWSYDVQKSACIATVKLLKPKAGSTVFGWQLGAEPAREVVRGIDERRKEHGVMFRHDEGSWEKLWREVGKETGTEWRVEADFHVPEMYKEHISVKGRDAEGKEGESRGGILWYCVTRL